MRAGGVAKAVDCLLSKYEAPKKRWGESKALTILSKISSINTSVRKEVKHSYYFLRQTVLTHQ
jgi:hypothetical protein